MCSCTPSKRQLWCPDCFTKLGIPNPIHSAKSTPVKMKSVRASEWEEFSKLVERHVENYTVPQYGDKGSDLASEYSVDDCIKQINKYAKRNGNNQRENQDKLDLIKIAHYAQLAFDLIEHNSLQ